MKNYNTYLITWWIGKRYYTKTFKMRKPAEKFAIKLTENKNAQERNFYIYDKDTNMIETFTF